MDALCFIGGAQSPIPAGRRHPSIDAIREMPVSDTVLNQILDRIGTINHRLEMINQRINLLEQIMTSRLQVLEATQRSFCSQTVNLLTQTNSFGTVLDISNQQRLNDIAARITKLEFKQSSRPNPT
jgi:hypothetical protein